MELAVTQTAMFPDIGRILIEQRQNSGDAVGQGNAEESGKGENDLLGKQLRNQAGDYSDSATADKTNTQAADMTSDQLLESEVTEADSTVQKQNRRSGSFSAVRERRISGDSTQDGSRIPRLTPKIYDSSANYTFSSAGKQATIEDIESALESAELDAASPDELELPMLEDFPEDVDLVYPVVENNYSMPPQSPVLFGYDHTQIRFDNQLASQQNSGRDQFYIPSSPYRPRKRLVSFCVSTIYRYKLFICLWFQQ